MPIKSQTKRGERSPARISFDRWQQVWKLKKRGWSGRMIARQLFVSHTTVQWYLKKGPPPGWKPYPERPAAEVVDLAARQERRGLRR